MIEFKAECGHTVRAKDEDAGKAVRCSYCGQEAAVPSEKLDDFDLLLGDLQDSAGSDAPGRPKKRKKGKPRPVVAFPSRADRFNPFGLILKLCWIAALASIVIVVSQWYVIPYFGSDGPPPAIRNTPKKSVRRTRTQPAVAAPARTLGLSTLSGSGGLYVASVPLGAAGFYIPSADAPNSGRIVDHNGCGRMESGKAAPRVSGGNYVVEVVFPWNQEQLTAYPRYTEFRRSIQDATDSRRAKNLNEYFLPDQADVFFVDEEDGRIYLVRQYHDVNVREGEWTAVRALFLPALTRPDTGAIWVEKLVTTFMPKEKIYRFREGHIRNELVYYGVLEMDLPFVLDALARMGVMPYVTADKKIRLFKIGVGDGVFGAPAIERRR